MEEITFERYDDHPNEMMELLKKDQIQQLDIHLKQTNYTKNNEEAKLSPSQNLTWPNTDNEIKASPKEEVKEEGKTQP